MRSLLDTGGKLLDAPLGAWYPSHVILSVDPGLRSCGLALWGPDGRLKLAGLARGSVHDRDADAWFWLRDSVRSWVAYTGAPIAVLAIELPQIYVRSRSKGDPNDLIQLAAVVGAICSEFGTFQGTFTYRPCEWKGQATKTATQERTAAKLSLEECKNVILPTTSLQHNVWDAIGIGLHHLKKTKVRP